MTTFIISLDLPDKAFEAALEVFEDRIQALPTVWFVSTDWTAEQIRSHFGNDSLVVEPLSGTVEWIGTVRPELLDWLAKHLGPSN